MISNSKIDTQIYFITDLVEILNENLFIKESTNILFLYNELNNNKYSIQRKSTLNFTKQLIPTDGQINMLGIDLPAWFGNLENCRKRVMVIGIDPMRSKKDFKREGADYNENVIIGTPYSFHLEKMWNNAGKYKYYSQFITSLFKNNFIYLTDVYKTFFYHNNLRSYIYYQQKIKKEKKSQPNNRINSNIFTELLAKEISIVKPDVIITLGDISFSHLIKNSENIRVNNSQISSELCSKVYYDSKINKSIPICSLMHLAARKNNLEKFRNKHVQETKSEDFGIVFFEILKKNKVVD